MIQFVRNSFEILSQALIYYENPNIVFFQTITSMGLNNENNEKYNKYNLRNLRY